FGQVKENVPDPATSSEGVAVLGAISDEVFKGRDFDISDDQLRTVISTLKRAAQTHAPAADAMSTVITTPAITDVAAGSEADARSVVAGAANPNAATVLYPAS